MKTFILLMMFLLTTGSCTKQETETNEQKVLYGTWKLIEVLISNGGPATWTTPNESYEHTFERNGNFISTWKTNCSTGNYSISTELLTFKYDCIELNYTHKFEFNSDKTELILTPTYINCIEECLYKYKKIEKE